MPQKLTTISPEFFNPDNHSLPIAGELLLAGDKVIINADGLAFKVADNVVADGWSIEVSRQGEMVEVAARGEQQDDGGFYFEKIFVMEASS